MGQQAQSHAQQTAAQRAAQGAFDPEDFRAPDFVETITSPDIDRDPDDESVPDNHAVGLEEKLSGYFGRHLALGYISEEEWEQEKMLDKARAKLVRMGYARRSGLGSKVSSEEARVKGASGLDNGELTPDMEQQLEAAFEERSQMRSLSINGRGWKGVTTVQTVTKTEGVDSPNGGSSGGWVSKLTGGLMG